MFFVYNFYDFSKLKGRHLHWENSKNGTESCFGRLKRKIIIFFLYETQNVLLRQEKVLKFNGKSKCIHIYIKAVLLHHPSSTDF